ncbi:MAG: molybdenum cofactor biosynthesis protein MoaE [Abditibacteriales bacterium]|nr:molybdenum cofactor biosynthesis protein MoaE [Abditibacteriales bacterium]MDW8365265.1 molybdenum cofactor biosynthesis protein MoaE [Abditibacteriales bacterium]
MFELWDKALSLDACLRAVQHAGAGAVVIFLGVVRNNSRGQSVNGLEYDAYKPMAERKLREIGEEIDRRWGAKCAILHRVGRLAVGEVSVIIAAAAPHRADAFEACRYAIERIKEVVPIWKKEFAEDGAWWIEGSTALTDKPLIVNLQASQR